MDCKSLLATLDNLSQEMSFVEVEFLLTNCYGYRLRKKRGSVAIFTSNNPGISEITVPTEDSLGIIYLERLKEQLPD